MFTKKTILLLVLVVFGMSSAYSQNYVSYSGFDISNKASNYRLKNSPNNDKQFMLGIGLGFNIPISNMKDRYSSMLFGNVSLHYKLNKDLYMGINIFSSPELATIFPYNEAANSNSLTSIVADLRYKFYTDKRKTSVYCNFGAGIYLTNDKIESSDVLNDTKTSVNPGGNIGIGLLGNVSENLILDVNSSYNLYYNTHLFELPKYSKSKIFNYVLISVSLKFII